MSHYVVIVTGDNIEAQLAPFNECLPTCENPKWDWYQVGGRWSGYFPLKEGAEGTLGEMGVFCNAPDDNTADVAKKGAVDVARARESEIKEAVDRWNDYVEVTKGLTPAPRWSSFLAEQGEDNIEAARELYHAHPWVAALSKAHLMPFAADPLDIYTSLEDMKRRAGDRALVPYAVLHNGTWFSQGEMGWFGISNDVLTDEEWSTTFWKWFNALPDDMLLTAVDCHI